MAANRWYFTREQIKNSPSVRNGIDYAKELGYRQQCANFIQDIGQRLTVNQLCINTSIVYMHRFYMFHSFKHFHRNVMAPCFLFLGAKVEEQPRKLEHVLKVAYRYLHKDSDTQLDNQSDEYMQMAQDLIDNESILLQTLGFELSVEHPHTFVIKCAQMVKAAKDLTQTSYFLATNSLHLTTFCIEQKPTVVACVCIYVACKWTSYEIPESHDKKHWWEYMDNEVTLARIEEMTSHFIKILDSCPSRLKKKISTGPVIFKGGTLQLKREDEDETGAVDKHNGASSSKTSSKAEEKGNSTSTSEKQHIKTEQSSDSSKIKERKEHASSSHGTHRHPTHQDGAKHSDLERKHADHQKHRSEHKHRHSEHSKHKSELSRHEDVNVSKQIAKKRPDMKDNEMKMPEIKSSSSISRPTERTRTKEAVVDEPSAAAKMILSLPPLQHKHSLSEHDLSSSESPAKKKKLDSDAVPTKKPKLDLDSSKVAGHPKLSLPSINSSHQKRHKSSHSKGSSSKEKHKEKLSSDKHPSLHQHKQQSSHKSSHGQKHHSKLLQDQHPGKLSESDYGSASDISINESPKKHISGLGLQKKGHDAAGLVSRPLKPIKTPQKSNSDPSGVFMKSMRTPQKSQGHLKSTSKNSISLPKEEISLPPPPPPPSVDVMSLLNSSPNEMFSKQTSTPSKGQGSLNSSQYGVQSDSFQMRQSSNQVTDQLPQSSIKDKQATSLLNQAPLHLVQPPHGILPMPPSGIKAPLIQASQPYQQQGQFISTSQAATSAGTTYGITPMYFQGQESQTASSNLGFGPSSRNASMFSPQAVTLPPPPLPPPGMILTQVRGLPPPPPLNLPFPPPT